MRKYSELSINEKIFIKALAMSIWNKRIGYTKPNSLNSLNELQVNYLLSDIVVNKRDN